MSFQLGPRRAVYLDVSTEMKPDSLPLSSADLAALENFDLVYRTLVAVLYNYAPTSGHPGGSISSGRIVASLLYDTLDYDFRDPDREDADILSYSAGHKALGLYAMWALRNEVARLGAPALLPHDDHQQLRLEDLLGFRRNPATRTPLFQRHHAKALDGHPTPATPFVKLSTGASGVGVGASIGLAWGARDYFGKNAPRVHIIEGEGGLTPGRVAEALAAAATASLDNVVVHVDWNQASIDSNRVCPDGREPGDYVQWTPAELFRLHDWNVVYVPDGFDFSQVVQAQRLAASITTGQPTAIVYRTVKGWEYGIEGRASHGAGHALCSDGFFEAIEPLLHDKRASLPTCCNMAEKRCAGADGTEVIEECFWEALLVLRGVLETRKDIFGPLAGRLVAARDRLDARHRKPRDPAPEVQAAYELAERTGATPPADLVLKPGTSTTLRGELGRVLGYYNKASKGAFFTAAADLLGSTSVNAIGAGFAEGFYHTTRNPDARLISTGGICEDAMAAIGSGISTFGHHIAVGSSYAAFIAPLAHIAARLHAIGSQARDGMNGTGYRPMIVVCAHAGLKTGEDGPTHADPQALQVLQENFPSRTMITLTPWDPAEMWPLVTEALRRRPAVIAPFVTRPNERVPDRAALRLAPADAAVRGLYLLRAAKGAGDGTVVLQESGVTMEFVNEVLPRLDREGIDINVYYVASAELFDALPEGEQRHAYPPDHAEEAMGITGFTLPTMYRWVPSERGRAMTLHPFQNGHFLGSGQARRVLEEAGLDGDAQYRAVIQYLETRAHRR